MKKHRWIWIGLLAAGALAAVVVLGGCSERRSAQDGHRGGRYAYEAAPRGERMPDGPSQGQRGSGRTAQQGRGGYAVEAADRPANRRPGGQTAAKAVESDGRSVVEAGELLTLAGSLESRDAEWYLNQEGSRYVLHLGNARYVESTGIRLQEAAEVQVRGFAEGSEVAVVSISIDGRRFDFRDEDGTPLWAGRGRQSAGGGRNGAGGARSGGGRGNADRV